MLLVAFVVLAGLLTTADRISVSVAQDRIADRLAAETPFVTRPSVTIHGFPFLTQALGGRYDDIEVAGSGISLGRLGPTEVDARLHGVHLSIGDATSHVDRVPVDRATLTFSVSLAALAGASGIDGLSLTAAGDRLTARGPVELDGLGTVTVSATGRLVIDGKGNITANLQSLSGVNATLPAGAQSAARRALGLVVGVEDLPFDAAATAVDIRSGQVVITAEARNIVLR